MTVKNQFFDMSGGHKPRMLTYEGKTMDLNDWARIKGIKKMTILNRLYRNEPIEYVLFQGDLRKHRREQDKK